MTTIPPIAFRRILRFFHGDGFVVGEPGGLEVAGTLTPLDDRAELAVTAAAEPEDAAAFDAGLWVAPRRGALPAPGALARWTRRLRPGGWLVLALRGSPDEGGGGDAFEVADLAWRATALLQAVPELRMHATTETEPPVGDEAGGLFFAIARRADDLEPAWAQPRLWLPPSCRAQTLFAKEAERPRVVLVTETAGPIPEVLAAAIPDADILRFARATVDDPADVASKATIAGAHLVIELAPSAAAAWAASADVDLVTIRPAPTDRPAWPRQRHVKPDPAAIAEAVAASLDERRAAGESGITLCMIVKNEEADLERCLRSVASIADEIVICDTGSTDRTPEIARRHTDLVYRFSWVDDFSWARNRSLERARRRYALWLDADDELKHASAIPPFLSRERPLAVELEVQDGDVRVRHTRIVRTADGIRFASMCHEYLDLRGGASVCFDEASVVHKVEPTAGKERFPRNVRILRRQVEAEPANRRAWYCLARVLRKSGDHAAARDAFLHMLEIAPSGESPYRRSNALRQLALCYQSLGQPERAREALFDALKADPRWAEGYLAIADHYLELGDDDLALPWLLAAKGVRRPRSGHIVHIPSYTWRPDAGLARVYARRGDSDAALECARRVQQHRDFSWEIATLERMRARRLGEVTCPLCGKAPSTGKKLPALGYLQCEPCGLGVPAIGPPHTSRELYPEEVVRRSLRWQRASEVLAAKIAKHATEALGVTQLRVLEIMPAIPVLAATLRNLGHQVTVVDLSPACVASPFAAGIEVVTSAWEDLVPPEHWRDRFDVLVLVHALECMPRLVCDLENAVRCVRPGGLVFSRHADPDSPGDPQRYDARSSFWLLGERAMTRLADRVGLEVVRRVVRQRGREADCWLRRKVAPEVRPRIPGPEVSETSAERVALDAPGDGRPSRDAGVQLTAAEELTARLQRRTYGGRGPCLALETGRSETLGSDAPQYWRRLVVVACRALGLSVLHVGPTDDASPFSAVERLLDLSYFDLRTETTLREAAAIARESDLHVSLWSSRLPRLAGAAGASMRLVPPGTSVPASASGSLRVEPLPASPESLAIRIGEALGLDTTAIPTAPAAPAKPTQTSPR